MPAAGAAIRSGDREIGQVTSSTLSPALERPIALGYVHRDFVAPGTDGDGRRTRRATVTALPFVHRAGLEPLPYVSLHRTSRQSIANLTLLSDLASAI